MRGKTIRQFLIDGQADGRWATELSNWTGKAYKFHVHMLISVRIGMI